MMPVDVYRGPTSFADLCFFPLRQNKMFQQQLLSIAGTQP